MNEDERMTDIYKKIEREKALINAANLMRQQTNNEGVRSKLDNQMREGRRNLEFFEERLRELQMRKMGQGMSEMTLAPGSSGGGRPRSATDFRDPQDGPPTPPPKDQSQWPGHGHDRGGSYGSSSIQYSQIGQHGDMMPSRAPFAAPAPSSAVPKPRPNFTKLGGISPVAFSPGVKQQRC